MSTEQHILVLHHVKSCSVPTWWTTDNCQQGSKGLISWVRTGLPSAALPCGSSAPGAQGPVLGFCQISGTSVAHLVLWFAAVGQTALALHSHAAVQKC